MLIYSFPGQCCSHPYIVDASVQALLIKGLQAPEALNVGIKASGKLQLLDMILSKIGRLNLRVLVLFQVCNLSVYLYI